MEHDEGYLLRCLELARIPGAEVEPNPRVGALVVHEGRIIGEGWHRAYGGPHAEVHAVAGVQAPEHLRESTLYVSLEPCNHHGKTPPCTDLILKHRIPRVVVGSIDPNPVMGGKSVELLRKAGVEVRIAANPAPFIELNHHFWTNQRLQRPYITLKWAESADGFIAAHNADGQAQRTAISGADTARWVHWLRHEHQAILIGSKTALIDDPRLDTRHWPGYGPLPILLDRDLEVPYSALLFQEKPRVLVLNAHREGMEGNVEWLLQTDDLAAQVHSLYKNQRIGSILVEGGTEVLNAFLAAGLADEVFRIVAPLRLESGLKAPQIPETYTQTSLRMIGEDRLHSHALRK